MRKPPPPTPPTLTVAHCLRWAILKSTWSFCIEPLTLRSGFAFSARSMLVSTAANYVGKAEVSTSDLRTGAAFNNLKAEWGRKLSLGDFSSQFDCTYDHQNCKDFLKDAKVPLPSHTLPFRAGPGLLPPLPRS